MLTGQPTTEERAAAQAYADAHAAQHYADLPAACFDDDPNRYGTRQGRRVVYSGGWVPESTAADFDDLPADESVEPDAAPAEPIAAAEDAAPDRRVVDLAELEKLRELEYGELIPLWRWDLKRDGIAAGKRPRDNGWVVAEYPRSDIDSWVEGGGNVGVRLRRDELVIDVDPKHADAKGRSAQALLEDLELELGIDLGSAPTVRTGSGGWHVYLKKDPDTLVRNTTEIFGGAIEYKSYGRQVVAPGSKHPNSERYQWVRNAAGPVPECPASLLEMIRKPDLPKRDRKSGDEISPEILERCLERLKPEDFQDYEKWRNLMFSVHFACNGSPDGLAAFVKWSTSDPKYAGASGSIEKFWEYATSNRSDARTEKSLFWFVEQAGGRVPYDVEREFPDELQQPLGEEAARPEPLYERNSRGGKIKHTCAENVVRACQYLGISVRTDTFANKNYVRDSKGALHRHFGVPDNSLLSDDAFDRIGLVVTREHGNGPGWSGDPTKVTIKRARVALTTEFHPVLDYLAELEWDGVPRIDRWLIEYGGAEDTEYVRAVGALPLIAAVRRVHVPGSKFDEVLVLESPQGKKKSRALKTLCPQPEWFADDFPLGVDSQKVIERTDGKWIIEAAELQGMRQSQIEEIKAELSRETDIARGAFKEIVRERPRQFVVIGTTNGESYLRDPTGNRRFWPVTIREFDLDALRKDRDQIWAEAAHREAAGESIRLRPELYSVAGEEQEQRRAVDPWENRLDDALGGKGDAGRLNGKIAAEDVWRLVGKVDAAQRAVNDNARLAQSIRAIGFDRPKGRKLRFDRKVQSAYVRFPAGVTDVDQLERIVVDVRRDRAGRVLEARARLESDPAPDWDLHGF